MVGLHGLKRSGGPLRGLRILDFSRLPTGPFCTISLADLGARVIRVQDLSIEAEVDPALAGLERNTECIAVNLADEKGRGIVRDLVRNVDIVVESSGYEGGDRPRFGYEVLADINPVLIYCGLSPFGQTGPCKERAADDVVLQAATGALSVTGELGRLPSKMGLPLTEEMGATFGAIAILAAVEQRDRTGTGCCIDTSFFDGGLAMLSYMANIFFATGKSPAAQGSSHPTIYPYNAFKVLDGYIVVAPFTQAFWRKFCKVVERPDLAELAQFKTFADRLANRSELSAILDPIMESRPATAWLAMLDAGDVPNGLVNSIAQTYAMPQTEFRGMVASYVDKDGHGQKTIGSPFHFAFSDGEEFVPAYRAPPSVGQDTRRVLGDIAGYNAPQLDLLVKEEIIGAGAGASQHDDMWKEPQNKSVRTGETPLQGLRVIDLTRMLAGPYAALILADLGADVIKIEEPKIGDPTRRNLPFLGSESTYFMALNRGKRSVTLDLKDAAARDRLLELVRTADIVVENYRPGVMARLGLSFHDLLAVKPDVILCSLSGYGQTGPLREKISFDLVNQAMAGTMAVTGEAGRAPVRVGLPIGDLAGGVFSALAILAALRERRLSGRGVFVDLALHDILIALHGPVGQRYLTTGLSPSLAGSRHQNIVPSNVYRTGDGQIAVSAPDQQAWERLTGAMGRPDLVADRRFATSQDRLQNCNAIDDILAGLFAAQASSHWLEVLGRARVPVAAVNSVGDALRSAQSHARDMVFSYKHAAVGEATTVGTPFRLNNAILRSSRPPPILGQHNDEVWAEDDRLRSRSENAKLA